MLGLLGSRIRGLSDDGSWAVVVTYTDDGYVSDEEAREHRLRRSARRTCRTGETREQRSAQEAGYETVQLIGWAARAALRRRRTRSCTGRRTSKFEGSPQHTLNYDIRVLGRRAT